MSRYHSLPLFRNFFLARFLDWELYSQKMTLNISAISLLSEITFATSKEISGSLLAFPFSIREIFDCKLVSSEKRGFTFSKKVLLPGTSSILRLL